MTPSRLPTLARVFRARLRQIGRWSLIVAAGCSAPEPLADGINSPPIEVVGVNLAPDTLEVGPGEQGSFRATAFLSDGSQREGFSVQYSATAGVIGSNGNYTSGPQQGQALVVASTNGFADTSVVIVATPPSPLVGLRITPSTAAVLPGGSQRFTVVGVLASGDTSAVVADFSATGGTISGSGTYTAGSTPGTYQVITSLKGGSPADTAVVTVGEPPASLVAVVMTPGSASLAYGRTQQFTAVGRLSDSSTTTVPLTWRATGGSVNSSGLYTAGSTAGNFRVIASAANGKADTSSIQITAPTIASIAVSPKPAGVMTGESRQFTAVATLSNGSTQNNPPVTWSATGGTISSSGMYTAGILPGTYLVIASANGKADTSTVTMTLANIVGLVVSPGNTNVVQGQSRAFSVAGALSNGGTILAPVVTWSATGGSISASGNYTAGTTPGNYRAVASLVGGAVADTADIAVLEQNANYPNRPANYTTVLSDLDMSQAVPSGGNTERYVAGTNNVWSVIYDGDDNGGSNWTKISDPTAPQSPSSVWQLRLEPGTWTDGHGAGNIGRPLNNVNEIYISYWVKWDPLFEFHPISSKHLRLQKDNGNFLVQASHDNSYLRASDEGIGQAYEPQISSKPTLGVWHHIEVVVKTGSPGLVKVWMDGTLRTNYTNLPVTGPFNAFSIDGHLGGGGMTKLRESFYWIDHIYIATP